MRECNLTVILWVSYEYGSGMINFVSTIEVVVVIAEQDAESSHITSATFHCGSSTGHHDYLKQSFLSILLQKLWCIYWDVWRRKKLILLKITTSIGVEVVTGVGRAVHLIQYSACQAYTLFSNAYVWYLNSCNLRYTWLYIDRPSYA